MLIILLFISFSISLLLVGFSYIFSVKNIQKEKVSSYECGFNHIYTPGSPYGIKFFIIAILFLIFDLEIVFLLPWSVSCVSISLFGQFIIYIFIFILIIGLFYE